MSTPQAEFSLATKLDMTNRAYGQTFFDALDRCDSRLRPTEYDVPPNRRAMHSVGDLLEAWGQTDRILGRETPKAVLWKRRKKLNSYGFAKFPFLRSIGGYTPGSLVQTADFDPATRWLGFLTFCCSEFSADAALLHILTDAETVPSETRFYRPVARCIGAKQIPNIAWATYFGPMFTHETDYDALKARGFHVEPLAGGYLVLLSDQITDVITDFPMISRRRAELKSCFRPDMFEIKYEPGDPRSEE